MPASLIRRDRTMIAVTIMLDIAFHAGRAATASASDIADRLGLARRGMEPILQALSRAGLLESIRGPRGGYRLGRPAREILLLDISSVMVGGDDQGGDAPHGQLQDAVVEPLWTELDEAVQAHMSKLTLNDLVRRAEAIGMRRTFAEPIAFVI